MKKMKFSTSQAAWTRLIILGFALLNQALTVLGYSVIPISDAELSDFIGLSFLVGIAIYTAWKNNSVTKMAVYKENLAEKEINKALVLREELTKTSVANADLKNINNNSEEVNSRKLGDK